MITHEAVLGFYLFFFLVPVFGLKAEKACNAEVSLQCYVDSGHVISNGIVIIIYFLLYKVNFGRVGLRERTGRGLGVTAHLSSYCQAVSSS